MSSFMVMALFKILAGSIVILYSTIICDNVIFVVGTRHNALGRQLRPAAIQAIICAIIAIIHNLDMAFPIDHIFTNLYNPVNFLFYQWRFFLEHQIFLIAVGVMMWDSSLTRTYLARQAVELPDLTQWLVHR